MAANSWLAYHCFLYQRWPVHGQQILVFASEIDEAMTVYHYTGSMFNSKRLVVDTLLPGTLALSNSDSCDLKAERLVSFLILSACANHIQDTTTYRQNS